LICAAQDARGVVEHSGPVRGDTGRAGEATREERCVTGSGFGYRVIMMCICEPCSAAAEPPETAIQLRAESVEVIAPKLINSDEDYEGWARRDCGSGCGFRGGCLSASYGRCACRKEKRSEYSMHAINIRAGQDAGNGASIP